MIGLPSCTTMPQKSLPSTPVEATPLATTLTGTFWACASNSETMLLKPNWNSPLQHGGHDGRAALRRGERQVNVSVGEEPLLLAEVDRRDVEGSG